MTTGLKKLNVTAVLAHDRYVFNSIESTQFDFQMEAIKQTNVGGAFPEKRKVQHQSTKGTRKQLDVKFSLN